MVQLVFLVIPMAGPAWTFTHKRGGFLLAAAALLGVLAFAWWPDGRYAPYRPGERGTLPEQVQSARTGAERPTLRAGVAGPRPGWAASAGPNRHDTQQHVDSLNLIAGVDSVQLALDRR